MTVAVEPGNCCITCDECGNHLANTSLEHLMVNAGMARWKVFNDPEQGVKHYCKACGNLPQYELAIALRSHVNFKDVGIRGDSGSSDATGLLDDIVVSAAKARGEKKPEATQGFSLDLED